MDISKRGQDTGETKRPVGDRHGSAAIGLCFHDQPGGQDPNLMKNLHAILCQSLLIFERIVKPFEAWYDHPIASVDGLSRSGNPEGDGLR